MVHPPGESRSAARATATPTPTLTFPAESFIRKKLSTLRRGDVKALAASSIAVVSSIGSPSLNKHYLPRLDDQSATHAPHPDHGAIVQEPSPHQATNSAWQTAYSTARMVIGITKESSDMFLPLKAVVGALSVLLQNYDAKSNPNHSRVVVLTVCVPANYEQCEAGGRDRGGCYRSRMYSILL